MRREIVDEDHIGVYHCIARWFEERSSAARTPTQERDYGHRKVWIVDRLRQLAGFFGIEVCDYAIMSNHLHLVLRNRPDLVQHWTDGEVALRWLRLFPRRSELTGVWDEPNDHDLAMVMADADRLVTLRARLASISWFMRCLSEWVARAANREEGCGGRFWAGRFKSQPLLDEAAVLACSVMSISTRSRPGSRPRQRNRTSRRVVTASGASQKGARHPPFRCQREPDTHHSAARGAETPGARHPPFPHHSAASSGSQTPTIPLPATIRGSQTPSHSAASDN